MAVKPWTVEQPVAGMEVPTGVKVYLCTLSTGDTSAPLVCPHYSDKNLQVTGTFAGTTVAVKGSNQLGVAPPDAALFLPVHLPDGTTAISYTAAGMKQILESPFWLMLDASAGAAADLEARLLIGTTARR